MGSLFACLHCMARPRLYTTGQWYALGLSVVCAAIGFWGGSSASTASRDLAWSFYGLQTALAFAVPALLWFAFSTGPRRLGDVHDSTDNDTLLRSRRY